MTSNISVSIHECDLLIVLPHLGPGGAQKVALLVAEHFLADELKVILVTLLPGKACAHVIPEGLSWIDLGDEVAATWSNRALSARTWRFMSTWVRRIFALVFVLIAWSWLKRVRPGSCSPFVLWIVTSMTGVQASLLHDLCLKIQPPRVLSLLTKTNLLCCQALWSSESAHLVVSERNDPRMQRLLFPWPRLQGWLWQRADVITANTAGVLEGLRSRSAYQAADMRLLPNPLALSVSNIASSSDCVVETNAYFLAVCRLVPQKGIDLLVRAYAQLPESVRSIWPLLIAGDGPERQTLEALALSLLPSHQVRFLGFQSHPETLYRQDAIFVLSSRYEGMPNSLLEAMAAGLAVIVSNASPGPLEVVAHGESGLVVPTEKVSPLTDAMQRLAEDLPLRRRLGMAASDLMQFHSWPVLDPVWRAALGLSEK